MLEIWFLLSFSIAAIEAARDALSKRLLHTDDAISTAWGIWILSSLMLFPSIFWLDFPPLTWQLAALVAVGGFLNAFINTLYLKALQASDISITIPMIAFSPAFMLFTSPLMLGEFPNLRGVLGIVVIVLGSLLLFKPTRKGGFSQLWKNMLNEKGPRIMLVVAFLWSITANLDKIGIHYSSPTSWLVMLNFSIALFLFFFIRDRVGSTIVSFKKNKIVLIIIAGLGVVAYFIQMKVITMTLVAYVISIKRLSTVFGVLIGYFVFREQNIKRRLAASLIMFVGVLLIGFSG